MLPRPPAWLLRRIPLKRNRPVEIAGRRIYLLPTREGVLYGLLTFTILVAAINYASSPAFLLAFLLVGLFLQTLLHSWRNLHGLRLRWVGDTRTFAGSALLFRLVAAAGDRPRHGLRLRQGTETGKPVDLAPGAESLLELPLATTRRGPFAPGVILLESRHPLGLVRTWIHLLPEERLLIWPRPLEPGRSPTGEAITPAADLGGEQGDGGDFSGYRNHQPGDSPGRIHWKALAAERGLLVKEFEGGHAPSPWLDFDALAPEPTERRLQWLAGAVELHHRQARPFGLRLPGWEAAPATGAAHRRRCLDALARFPHSGPQP